MISELSIHIAIVHWLRQHIQPGWKFWHTPNGELRDARQTAKFKALGVMAGVRDLTVVSPQGRLHFMEIKRENGALDTAQEDVQLFCIRAQVPHSVVRSINEAEKVFKFWDCVKAIPETAARDA